MRTLSPIRHDGAMVTPQRWPIGIQTFREIREEGHYYVDKTGFAVDLVRTGKTFFSSRPRRFGKSLFLDTLKELFAGSRDLFTGLAAEDRWDWSVKYPVIRISLGRGLCKSPDDVHGMVEDQLLTIEAGLPGYQPRPTVPRRLAHLIQALHGHMGQRVVVLVDEYDKPILDNLAQPALARQMRDALRSLYGVLKALDAHLKFVFLTGVSKFSKVSLFSGLNQRGTSRSMPAGRPCAATPRGTSRRYLPPNWTAWTSRRCVSGTTATTGAGKPSTTLLTSCFTSSSGSSDPTGSRRGPRLFLSNCWPGGVFLTRSRQAANPRRDHVGL